MKNKTVRRGIAKAAAGLLAIVLLSAQAPAKASPGEAALTTRLNDWMKLFHITAAEQAQNGVKGGEGAQLVFSMAISPHDPRIMLLGNDTCGVYRSEDAGQSWTHSSQGIGAPGVIGLLFDPDVENLVYACVSTSSAPASRVKTGKIGIYKSTDNGLTWRFVKPLSNFTRVSEILVYGPKSPDGTRPFYTAASDAEEWDGRASGATGVFVSRDRGESWQSAGLEAYAVYGLHCQPGGALLAATSGGIFESRNEGASWQQKPFGLPHQRVTSITVNPVDSAHWVAGFANEGAYLAESRDAGQSWQALNTARYGREESYPALLLFHTPTGCVRPRLYVQFYKVAQPTRYSDDYGASLVIPEFRVAQSYYLLASYNGYFPTPFVFHPQNPDIVYTSKITPYRSEDGGASFSFSGSGYSGILASDWQFDQQGGIRYMAIADLGFVRFDAGDGGVLRPAAALLHDKSFDGASSSTAIAVDPNDPLHAFATFGGAIYGKMATLLETRDGFMSTTWVEPMRTEVENSEEQIANRLLQYHPQNPSVLYTDWYASEDNGASWRRLSKRVRAVSPFDGDILYSLTDYTLYRSPDRGRTWEDTGFGVPQRGHYRALIADQFHPEVIWAAEYGRVCRIDLLTGYVRVSDGGAQKLAGDDGGELEITSIAQNPNREGHLLLACRDYTGAGSYMFESFDGGAAWRHMSELSPLAYAGSVKFHPYESLVFLGSPMGTIVYEYENNPLWGERQSVSHRYDGNSGQLTLSARLGEARAYTPARLELIAGSGGHHTALQKTVDAFGDVEFTCPVSKNSGSYLLRFSFFGGEGAYEEWFSTDEQRGAVYGLGPFGERFRPQRDKSVQIIADVGAFLQTAQSLRLVLAYYDEAGALIRLETAEGGFGYTKEYLFLESEPPESAASAKGFLWDGLSTVKPLAGAAEF